MWREPKFFRKIKLRKLKNQKIDKENIKFRLPNSGFKVCRYFKNFNVDELFRNEKGTSRKEKMEGDGMKIMEGEMKWNNNNVTDNCVVFYGCWPLRGQNPGLGCVSLGSFERPLRGLSGIMRDRGQIK